MGTDAQNFLPEVACGFDLEPVEETLYSRPYGHKDPSTHLGHSSGPVYPPGSPLSVSERRVAGRRRKRTGLMFCDNRGSPPSQSTGATGGGHAGSDAPAGSPARSPLRQVGRRGVRPTCEQGPRHGALASCGTTQVTGTTDPTPRPAPCRPEKPWKGPPSERKGRRSEAGLPSARPGVRSGTLGLPSLPKTTRLRHWLPRRVRAHSP